MTLDTDCTHPQHHIEIIRELHLHNIFIQSTLQFSLLFKSHAELPCRVLVAPSGLAFGPDHVEQFMFQDTLKVFSWSLVRRTEGHDGG